VTLGEKKFLNLTNRQTNLDSDFLKVTVRLKDGSKETYFHASILEIPEVAQRKKNAQFTPKHHDLGFRQNIGSPFSKDAA